MTKPMTDAELAKYLHLTDAEAAKILPTFTPEKRALFDRMAEVEFEANLWAAGLGPKPSGVVNRTQIAALKRRKISRAFLET